MRHTVSFEPWGTAVEVDEGCTILDAARAAGIAIGAVCGGRGTCGKCRIRILAGSPAPAAPAEMECLPPGAAAQGERLACRTVVSGPISAEAVIIRALDKAAAPPLPPFALDPLVRRRAVAVRQPTLEHPVDDAESLLAALAGGAACIDSRALRELPTVLRAADWRVAASIRGDEVIGVRPASAALPPLGLAVDLGTTTIAASLYRLDDAAPLGSWTAANPLAVHGADIITRMSWALAAAGNGARLQRILARSLTALAQRAAGEAGAAAGDIEEMVVVGNSGMHHLLLDLPGDGLMSAPFVPAVRTALSIKARDLGIGIAPGAFVHLPPLVGGFIGSDLLAVVLAARLSSAAGVRLALDIGTNTEILLAVDGSLDACSTASGPALEGAALRFGSLAGPGAIDRVRPADHGDALAWNTIGGLPPSGICGSGVIDLLACLHRTGALSGSGRLSAAAAGVLPDPGGDHRYILVPADQTALGVELTVSQTELRALQLAKGAIRAGIDTLLARRGIAASRIDEVLVAGNFGTRLDAESALRIGLLPPVSHRQVRRIGNAAATGAALMLLSKAERLAAAGLARSIRCVELARDPGFQLRFARAQWFPGEER